MKSRIEPRPARRDSAQRAFTLVELLVVIAIFGILIALLIYYYPSRRLPLAYPMVVNIGLVKQPRESDPITTAARNDYAICEGDVHRGFEPGPPDLASGNYASYVWPPTRGTIPVSRACAAKSASRKSPTVLNAGRRTNTLLYFARLKTEPPRASCSGQTA